jgi:hypothetical protein
MENPKKSHQAPERGRLRKPLPRQYGHELL